MGLIKFAVGPTTYKVMFRHSPAEIVKLRVRNIKVRTTTCNIMDPNENCVSTATAQCILSESKGAITKVKDNFSKATGRMKSFSEALAKAFDRNTRRDIWGEIGSNIDKSRAFKIKS